MARTTACRVGSARVVESPRHPHRRIAIASPACPTCGRTAGPDDRFCGRCGNALSLVCSRCGRAHSTDLTYCTGPTFNDVNNSNLTWGIACNMTGGSSGGPWIGGFSQAGGGTLTSLNSYGYTGLSNMYGPKFNSNTQAVYNRANTTTGNSIVP